MAAYSVKNSLRAIYGFTMIEVLVALVILSLSMVALISSYGTNILITTRNKSSWTVMNHVQAELLHHERKAKKPTIGVENGVFDNGHQLEGYRWERRIQSSSPIPGVTVMQMVYTVFWEEDGIERSYEASTYIGLTL